MGVSDTSSLSLHNILDKDGKATADYVVQSGKDFYAASVNAASGKVTLNTIDVTYDDYANGVDDAKQTGQLIKVSADKDGTAQGFVTLQGKNYSAGDAADILKNGATALELTDLNLSDVTDTNGKVTTTATEQFEGASTEDPLALLDKAIASVDKFRSSIGAVQNRLDSAITNLNNTTTNLSEAQSRIQDADYATEVSNMSKAQIIQQAGNSVLSKANQVPQQVLSLLQG